MLRPVYGNRIDILVNTVGVAPLQPIADMSIADWRRVVDIDLTGRFLSSPAVIPEMIQRRSGRIISIGSQLRLTGAFHMTHYCDCAAPSGVPGPRGG